MKKIEQKTLNFIDQKNLINKGDKVLIALSGGPDSVFLLYFLFKYKTKLKIDLGAMHINHRLRGTDSDTDQKFCKSLCKKYKVNYYTKNRNVKAFALKNKISIEEAGREIRYKELKLAARKYGYKKIATAHNSTDNTETTLLNLFKGTGIDGISGIPFSRGNIIRPILCIKKNDIVKYLDNNKINYRVDTSNLNNDYERNFIRNKILPLIKENINPNFEESIFRSSEIFKDIKKLINDRFDDSVNKIIKSKKNKLKILLNSDFSANKRNLSFLIKKSVYEKFEEELNFKNINDIISLTEKRIGQKVDLPGKLIAQKERGMIIINNKTKKTENVLLTVKP
ncbi:MAG: tRNA lysidine(34) synthetase TilS, partial [Ignavibacteriales bacterium CG12_big_fil_rev_8_21_14_0_65_30_8]